MSFKRTCDTYVNSSILIICSAQTRETIYFRNNLFLHHIAFSKVYPEVFDMLK